VKRIFVDFSGRIGDSRERTPKVIKIRRYSSESKTSRARV